jgi:cyclophilin family peptidyl-prolyl cis-trans isomerase
MLAIIGGVTMFMVIIGTVAAGFLGSSSSDSSSSTTISTSTTVEALALPLPAAGESISGETPCPADDGSSARTTSFENPPPTCIDPALTWTAVIETTEGPITVLLNTDQAPGMVNNFVVLSRYHYYDGVSFFSVLPQAYLATGDPVGDPLGTGGPGYTLPDEIPEVGVIYPWGTLAMAGEQGVPDSNGSVFLISSGDDAADLPPVYTVFGQVLDGADAIKAINDAGDPATARPTKDIRIESITVTGE